MTPTSYIASYIETEEEVQVYKQYTDAFKRHHHSPWYRPRRKAKARQDARRLWLQYDSLVKANPTYRTFRYPSS